MLCRSTRNTENHGGKMSQVRYEHIVEKVSSVLFSMTGSNKRCVFFTVKSVNTSSIQMVMIATATEMV